MMARNGVLAGTLTLIVVIWALARDNLSSGVCEQHRHRPACASAQTDQRLCYICSLNPDFASAETPYHELESKLHRDLLGDYIPEARPITKNNEAAIVKIYLELLRIEGIVSFFVTSFVNEI